MNFTQILCNELKSAWAGVFAQQRTRDRAVDHGLTLARLDSSRTIAHALSATGRDQQDWSSEYNMFSRSPWKADRLFDEPLRYCVQSQPEGPIMIVGDDTKIKKSGTKIPGVTMQRDPMSPAFHVNLIRASRYLQAAAVVRPSQEAGARTLPVCFRETPVLKKPGKRATKDQLHEWKTAKKTQNLPTAMVNMCRDLRDTIDQIGAAERNMLMVVDNSFCNSKTFSTPIERVDLLGRCRKDAKLARPAQEPGRVYDALKFTPEQVRKDKKIRWKKVRVFYGGQRRTIRCKEVRRILWQGGAKRRMLRLIVIEAQPYRTSPNSPVNYRDEAYYLTTDIKSPLSLLVQAAFDRWQIEVNHREEKTGFGVGEAQVRSPKSVPRHPAFAVAVYSMMHLCAIKAFGPTRNDNYFPLPRWRRNAKRPSIMDLKRLLQHESPNPTQQPPKSAPNQRHSSTAPLWL